MKKKTNTLRNILVLSLLVVIIVSIFLVMYFNNDNNPNSESRESSLISEKSEISEQVYGSSPPVQLERPENIPGTSDGSNVNATDSSDTSNESPFVESSEPNKPENDASYFPEISSSDMSEDRSEPEAHHHIFGDWVTLENATCTDNGKEQRICISCGEKQTQKIYAYGHSYDSGSVIKEAESCTAVGQVRYTCNTCGNIYNTETRGAHSFIHDDVDHISTCVICKEKFYDDYIGKEPYFIPLAEDSAMATDAVKLQQQSYTGKLSTWSEKWFEYGDVIVLCMMARSEAYYVGAPLGDYPYNTYDSEEDAEKARDEFILFLDDFEDVYSWRPDVPTVGFYHDPWTDAYTLFFDLDKMYKDFKSQMRKLSKESIEEIEKNIAAYLVHKSGIYNGMSVYNAASIISEVVHDWAYYDFSLRLHDAIDGFALRSCVCDGYAKMYLRLAEYCGIDAEMVIGKMKGQGHAWVQVTFSDGTVRYVDPTHCTTLMHPDCMNDYSW